MSAEEDDTFDIDIYGDDEQAPPEAEYSEQYDDQQIDFDDANGETYSLDGANEERRAGEAQDHTVEADQANEHSVGTVADTYPTDQSGSKPIASGNFGSQPQQGTKRKAAFDELDHENGEQHTSSAPAPLADPQATSALKLSELNWWTTEEDLRNFCRLAGVEDAVRDLAFSEHKINGKSRGEAYIEFDSADASSKVKKEIEKANEVSETAAPGKRIVLGVHFSSVGNPFKTGPTNNSGPTKSGGQFGSGGRGGRDGAYERNSYGAGNRGGRGGWNQNRGGGGFTNSNGMYNNRMNQQQQNQSGWNNAGGGMMNTGSMGGFGPNPMMNMMFQNMNRGGMMPNMGRGGYGGGMGMGMNNMGMGMGMNQRGGGGMGGMNMGMGMSRGGWNGGYQGGMQQGYGGGYMQQQQPAQQQQNENKRPRMG